jgi:hypothetical protein
MADAGVSVRRGERTRYGCGFALTPAGVGFEWCCACSRGAAMIDSMWLNFAIFAKTAATVLSRSGAR